MLDLGHGIYHLVLNAVDQILQQVPLYSRRTSDDLVTIVFDPLATLLRVHTTSLSSGFLESRVERIYFAFL